MQRSFIFFIIYFNYLNSVFTNHYLANRQNSIQQYFSHREGSLRRVINRRKQAETIRGPGAINILKSVNEASPTAPLTSFLHIPGKSKTTLNLVPC